jgi:RNA polymerase sigma factor (sigma-70 family)
VKTLRQSVFSALNRLEGIQQKLELKNNNSLKELKASVGVAMTRMFEVCGKAIGRRASFAAVDLNQYKNIAYRVAHQYKNKLYMQNTLEEQQILSEMIDAGMEGISQGLTMFDTTKNTKMSTFLFNRAQYAVSKYYQKLLRERKRKIISLNTESEDGETELQSMIDIAEPDVFETVSRRMQHNALHSIMNSLPERERTVLRLCAEGSLTKAAKQVNMLPKDVKLLLESVKTKIMQASGNYSPC